MDYFETSVSYDTLTHKLNEVRSELSVKYNKTAMIFNGLWLFGALLGLYFIIAGGFHIAMLLIPILGFGFVVLLTQLITKGVLKAKIRNHYLNKEVVNLFNFTEGSNVYYKVKPVFNKQYNSEMALFVRYASASCKYKIYNENPEQLGYEILRTSLVTSNGKSTTVHFDGDYLIINFPTDQDFHIKHRKQRTNRKGLKFYKTPDEEFHIYLSEKDYDKEEKRVIRPINRQFISLYSFVREVFQTDKVYIGSNKEQLHIAITEKVKFKMPKEFNYDNVKEYYDEFTKVIKRTHQVIDYINDQEFI